MRQRQRHRHVVLCCVVLYCTAQFMAGQPPMSSSSRQNRPARHSPNASIIIHFHHFPGPCDAMRCAAHQTELERNHTDDERAPFPHPCLVLTSIQHAASTRFPSARAPVQTNAPSAHAHAQGSKLHQHQHTGMNVLDLDLDLDLDLARPGPGPGPYDLDPTWYLPTYLYRLLQVRGSRLSLPLPSISSVSSPSSHHVRYVYRPRGISKPTFSTYLPTFLSTKVPTDLPACLPRYIPYPPRSTLLRARPRPDQSRPPQSSRARAVLSTSSGTVLVGTLFPRLPSLTLPNRTHSIFRGTPGSSNVLDLPGLPLT